MARPLSEEKRQALLNSAAECVASFGTGASTAKIAKAAGVSEGTLFTYFPTKDDLLNQLFLEIETNLTETMLAPYPADASARDRLCAVWNRLIDWGLAHATARSMVEECLAGHAAPDRITFYIDTILFDLADISINAVTARPKESDTIRQAGFDLFWKGSAA
jgi:AcrR family transcriptional regulator